MSKYNFERNLIKLSEKQDIESALSEWCFIMKEKRESKDIPCICQHKVRHAKYMYNVKTMKTIIVGSSCYKKFNLTIPQMRNTIYRNILVNILEKGEYTLIDDVLEYSEQVQYEVIKHFQNEIRNAEVKALECLLEEVKELVYDYGLMYLNDIIYKIQKQIKLLYQQTANYDTTNILSYSNCAKTKHAKSNTANIDEQNKRLKLLMEQCSCKITTRCVCMEPEFRKVLHALNCNKCSKWRCIHDESNLKYVSCVSN